LPKPGVVNGIAADHARDKWLTISDPRNEVTGHRILILKVLQRRNPVIFSGMAIAQCGNDTPTLGSINEDAEFSNEH